MNNLQYKSLQDFKASFAASGKNPIVTQHTLQLEAALTTTETTLDFRLTEDNGKRFRTEKRLNVNDIFQITRIGIYIAVADGDDDTEYRLLTYPNAKFLPTTKKSLETLYKGDLRITVDNKIYMPSWSVLKHYSAPRTQDANTPADVVDSINYNVDGFVQLTPTIVLHGNKTSQIQINLPTAVKQLEAGKQTRVILRLDGNLAQNAATFNV